VICRATVLILAAVASLGPCGIARAQQRDSLVIESRVLHERRLINIRTPRAYGDPTQRTRRFSVLYMPDGAMDEDFPHVVRAVDSLTAAGLIPPTIVVGIPNTERRRDLTMRYRTTGERAIVGESLAGLFIVETLLREPSMFQRYAALDPSLWWNGGAIVDSAASMLGAMTLSTRSD
jgi:predicted alpha/beta superfamily hydrolase